MRLHHLESAAADPAAANEWLHEHAGYRISSKASLADLGKAKTMIAEARDKLGSKAGAHKDPAYVEKVVAEAAVDAAISGKIAARAGHIHNAGHAGHAGHAVREADAETNNTVRYTFNFLVYNVAEGQEAALHDRIAEAIGEYLMADDAVGMNMAEDGNGAYGTINGNYTLEDYVPEAAPTATTTSNTGATAQ